MRMILTLIGIMTCLFPAGSQTREEAMELFSEGQYFLNREDYREAAYYFKKIADLYPDNANFNFKLGECYMNLPGIEAKAVPCFEIAIQHTVAKKKYNRKDFGETNAPLHAYFYLGNVYRIINRLDDALKVYKTFINSPFYYGNYNESIVENEIKSCERAKIIQDNPVEMVELALDSSINTSSSELYPVISGDENTLVFVRKLKFYDAIYLTTRQGNSWSLPENLNPVIGSDGDFYPACLSADGKELYLIKTGTNSDIWVSVHSVSGWSKAGKLNSNINTKADETSAWLSLDGKTLYFVSSRKRGYGGKDIYFSSRDMNNRWGRAHNLGGVVNTAFDEENPCLTQDDNTLFFSSRGHFSMGGFDIFYTRYADHAWGEPVNLGFPINNTADNLGFVAIRGGKTGYFSKINPADPAGEADIFRVSMK
jgi:tetratricopeptide (TPR) repeat protein